MGNQEIYEKTAARFMPKLARRKVPFYIAPGESASEMVNLLEDLARRTSTHLPTIHRLSREQSHLLYSAGDSADPLAVLGPILATMPEDYWLGHSVPIIDDYSLDGNKPEMMNLVLEEAAEEQYDYHFDIMVGGTNIGIGNVDVFTVIPQLALWLNAKYNHGYLPEY